jgi:hypothetical protein
MDLGGGGGGGGEEAMGELSARIDAAEETLRTLAGGGPGVQQQVSHHGWSLSRRGRCFLTRKFQRC